MTQNRKFNIIRLLFIIVYIFLLMITDIYYNNNYNILECINIIGNTKSVACIYEVSQESIIFIYKFLSIFSYVMIFVNLILNIYLCYKEVYNYKI